MERKELGNTAVCMEGYAWKGRKELDTPTLSIEKLRKLLTMFGIRLFRFDFDYLRTHARGIIDGSLQSSEFLILKEGQVSTMRHCS